jgi:MFS family permease
MDTGVTDNTEYAAVVQRRTVGVLSMSQILSGIAVAGTIPAGALLANSIADSDAAAGFAQTSVVTGAALVALPLARIALSRGRRSSLSTGYAVGGAGAAVVAVAAVTRSLPLVYLGSLMLGAAQAASYQARYAATDLATEHQRARALSWVIWAATIGAVLGPNLLGPSGVLGEAWGLPALAGPYLVAVASLTGAATLLFLLLRPDPYLLATRHRTQRDGAETRPRLRDGIAHLRRAPVAVAGIATIAVGHVVMVMVMVMTPVHMAHVDVTVSLIGLVISVHIVGMYAFSPVVGWLVDRMGSFPVIYGGLGILVTACVTSGFTAGDNVPVLGLGLLLLGIGWSCTLIAGSTLVVDSVGARERPAVQGLSDLTMNIAGALGGAMAGVIVLLGSYTVLCLSALVPITVLGVWMRRVRSTPLPLVEA